jgi:hypothetical protein
MEDIKQICEWMQANNFAEFTSTYRKEIFYGMPIEIVLKACGALQQVGKAQVFYSDNTDTHGVKFFNI